MKSDILEQLLERNDPLSLEAAAEIRRLRERVTDLQWAQDNTRSSYDDEARGWN